MNLSEAARALLRDCERLARRATSNEYAEAHVHLWVDGLFVAVALDLGGFVWRGGRPQTSAEARPTFAEGYGKTPEEALHQLARALRREIEASAAWPAAQTTCFEAPPPEGRRSH